MVPTSSVVVDTGDIVKGKAVEMRLEPGDIAYVPNAPISALRRYGNVAVDSFDATVAAN